MLTLKQYVEMRVASAQKAFYEAKEYVKKWEAAATAIENGKSPSAHIRQAYANWLGLQPKESRP